LDLEADNYYFEPTFLRGTPGQKLKVEIENESSTVHNFSIPDQHLDVKSGERKSAGCNRLPIVWGGALFLQVSLGERHEWRTADRRRQASGRLLQNPNKTSWLQVLSRRKT